MTGGALTETDQKLRTRFRGLGQRFNEELRFRDQRLHFLIRRDRRNVVVWLLRSSSALNAMAPPGTACVITASGNDEAVIYLAYSEHWVNAGRKEGYRFESSNLRFVVASADHMGEIVQFRLEWAARWDDGSGTLVFPGLGAAHPHWQIDLDKMHLERGVAREIAIDLAPEVSAQEIDLFAPEPGRLEFTERSPHVRWFHKLHLPARAMWHETPCAMPHQTESHQHEPSTVGQIDDWVLSAVRYLRHEFSIYP